MSILIKGLEMPQSCWDCMFCLDFEFLFPYECAAANKEFENGIDEYEHSRPNWCPLIELPPHGRLIDKDALLSQYGGMIITAKVDYAEGLRDAIQDIQNAPTVIEAEEGE